MIIKPGKENDKALKLWNKGLLDTEASKKMGCTALQFGVWRRRQGLPNNRGIFDWTENGYYAEGSIPKKYMRR